MSIACQIGFGKANYSLQSVALGANLVTAPFQRSSAASASQPRAVWSERASGNLGVDINGSMYSCACVFPDGTVLCFQAGWTRGRGRLYDGIVFVRLRSGAARHRVNAKIPADLNNVLGTMVEVFVGEADILGLDELEAAGITVPPYIVTACMTPEELDATFEVELLAEERTRPPTLTRVQTTQGERVMALATPAPRRLRFRPKG